MQTIFYIYCNCRTKKNRFSKFKKSDIRTLRILIQQNSYITSMLSGNTLNREWPNNVCVKYCMFKEGNW